MAETFTRADGIRFVADNYRELYANQYGALIKKNILAISSTLYEGKNRSFAVISKQQSGAIKVALNDTRGYLLGESVLRYLQTSGDSDASSNIIWSERLPSEDGNAYAAIVIVIGGEVVYDAISSVDYVDLNALNIIDDADQQFEVIVHGDLPLFEFDNESKRDSSELYIDSNKVFSFKRYDQSIIPVIPIVREFKLVTVATAIARRRFLSKGVLVALSFLIIVIVLALLYVILKPDLPEVDIEVPETISSALAPTPEIDPFEGYKRELQTPSIAELVRATLEVRESLVSLKGASVSDFRLNGNFVNASIEVLDDAPLYESIREELTAQGWNVSLGYKQFSISRSLFLANRPEPTFIMGTSAVIESLLDSASSLGIDFAYTPGVAGPDYSTTNASVVYSGSVDEIKLLGDVLSKYPTTLGRLLISGDLLELQINLEFTIYGDGS